MELHAFSVIIKQINKGFTWAIVSRSEHEKQFKEAGPIEKWWRGFKKQYRNLSLRTPDGLDRGKSRMANKNSEKSF